MPVTTNIAAQAAIDEEITMHLEGIITLKRRRNTYAAIGQLPDEVLTEIFLSFSVEDPSSTELVRWLNTTRAVCHRWRDVVLNSPRAWANITLTPTPNHLKFAALMLELCKAADLSVHIAEFRDVADDDTFYGLVGRILAQMHRISDLTVSVSSPDVLHRVFTLLPDNLQALRLHRLQVSSNTALTAGGSHLFAMFKTIDSPFLTTLDLTSVDLPSTFPYLPHLRNFTLFPYRTVSTTPSRILNALQHMPNLFHLHIEHTQSDDASLPPLTEGVTLAHLRQCTLSFAYLSQCTIFDYLDFPPTATVRAHFGCSHDPNVESLDLSPLCDFIWRVIDYDKITHRITEIYIEFPTVIQINTRNEVLVSILIPRMTSPQDISESSNVFATLGLSPAPISISTEVFYERDCAACIRHLSNTRTLEFTEGQGHYHIVLEGLLRLPGEVRPPCPRLKSIQLQCRGNYPSSEREKIKVVEAIVRERKQFRIPLERISVKRIVAAQWLANTEFGDLVVVY
ncbi:hypothetical protein ONZ45_g19388 [Pleurotus djamor]|nr:hypothetical protein ONZ45_g19388 [Pleurotus djamor]